MAQSSRRIRGTGSMNELKVVLVLTLFRRPERTRQILAALDACYNVAAIPVYLSCDYAPEYADACREVFAVAHGWVKKEMAAGRCNRHVLKYATNLGIDLHKIDAIASALAWSGADSFILMEDDTPPFAVWNDKEPEKTPIAPDVLNYFCTMLARTADEPDTLAVCGYNRQGDEAAFDAVKGQPYGMFRSVGFNPWGWAMTKAQWQRFFGDGGKEYAAHVDCPNGRFDWWLHSQGLQVVQPVLPRPNHVGGVRCGEGAALRHVPLGRLQPVGVGDDESAVAAVLRRRRQGVRRARRLPERAV